MNKSVRNLWRSGVMVAVALSLTPALARADQPFDGHPSASSSKVRLAPPGLGVPDHYIVVLDETQVRFGSRLEKVGLPTPAQVGQVLVARHGGRILKAWDGILPALYVKLPGAAVTRMSGDGVVRYLEQVKVVTLPSTSATSCVSSITKSAPRQPVKSHSVTQILDCPALDPRYHVDHGNCTPGVDCYDCSDNWGLARINQPAIPASTSYEYDYDPAHAGTPTVHVYMVDTGVDTSHSDFAGRISSGYNAAYLGDPLANNVEDCTGHGHGTHTSGIAVGDRYGVAKDALLHPIKFHDECDYSQQAMVPECPNPDPCGSDFCGSNSAAIVDAFNHIAVTHAATYGPSPAVVNLSANLTTPSDSASQAAQNLIDNHGIQVFQSAGNNSDFGAGADVCSRTLGTAAFPADVVVVGGSDIVNLDEELRDVRWIREGLWTNNATPPDPSNGLYCKSNSDVYCRADAGCSGGGVTRCDCGSNTGECVDLWAPAAHVVSASNEAGTESCRLSGTSMAAPHVTGVAALILMEHPYATPEELRVALRDYAVEDALFDDGDLGSPDPAVDPYSIGTSVNLMLQAHLSPLAETWVDFAGTHNVELGTENLPYDTLTEGIIAVVEGTVLKIFAGATSESVVIDKPMTLQAVGGTVTISASQ